MVVGKWITRFSESSQIKKLILCYVQIDNVIPGPVVNRIIWSVKLTLALTIDTAQQGTVMLFNARVYWWDMLIGGIKHKNWSVTFRQFRSCMESALVFLIPLCLIYCCSCRLESETNKKQKKQRSTILMLDNTSWVKKKLSKRTLSISACMLRTINCGPVMKAVPHW